MKFTIQKAQKRKAVVGERRKWRDGVYIKGADHQWHREKISKLAREEIKGRGKAQHLDNQILNDFTSDANDYIDWLDENNLHPQSENEKDQDKIHDYFSELFDDEDWVDDDGYFKWAQALHDTAKKVHEHITSEHQKGRRRYETMETPNPKAHEKVMQYVVTYGRNHTVEEAGAKFDGQTINKFIEKNNLSGDDVTYGTAFKELQGKVVDLDGEKYVFLSMTEHSKYVVGEDGFNKRVSHYEIYAMDRKGSKVYLDKEFNDSPIRVLPNPLPGWKEMTAEDTVELQKNGIGGIIFDEGISEKVRREWEVALEDAFKIFGKKLNINFKNVVKVHVYGNKNVNRSRSVTADYSSDRKVIQLSVKKAGSQSALAHEMGHAVDDMLNGWAGCRNTMAHLKDVVEAFRSTDYYKDTVKNYSTGRNRSWVRNWFSQPQEAFAMCFETYVAHKVPEWLELGYAKKVVPDQEFVEKIMPIMDKIFKDKKFIKAIRELLNEIFTKV